MTVTQQRKKLQRFRLKQILLFPVILLASIISAQGIDYTCNLQFDSSSGCQMLQDGVCDDPNHGGSGGESCRNQDCIDCNRQCKQFDNDCYGCLNAQGCYYCPGDGTCFNSNLYSIPGRISACEDSFDYLGSELGHSPDECIANAYTKDPLFEGNNWMYEMVNVVEAWKNYGYTGKGVTIRVNDDGVYVDNREFDDRFDDPGNSCPEYLPIGNNNHGTSVTGIILGNANNDQCAVGVAYEARFNACNFFTEQGLSVELLTYKLESFDISQNSIGLPGCDDFGLASELDVIFDTGCPFKFNSEFNVCQECNGEFAETDRSLSFDCEDAITEHCKNYYKEDVDACLDFPEIVIGGECDYDRLPRSAVTALETGVTQGRNGKGTIFTFASGNAFTEGDDVNFNGWTNSRYAITVGAVGKDGYHADYSTGGAALVVVAPAGADQDVGHLMTAGIGRDTCADSGQGSSFACPVVSGVIALMLEANPELSWRDVQGIIAQTSRAVNDDEDDTRNVNGAGFWHSNWYGFGIVDAMAAVEAAVNWQLFAEELQAIGISAEENTVLSDNNQNEFVSTIRLDPNSDGYVDSFAAESTVVLLDLSHYNRGDLEIELLSPSGTKSILHPGRRPENNQLTGEERWKLMTVRNWGENPTGDWSLKIRDLVNREGEGDDNNVFRGWKLIVYGHSTAELRSVLTAPPTYPPIISPTSSPTEKPTNPPTQEPTPGPTDPPTNIPTKIPTKNPTMSPTRLPTDKPTNTPTKNPTDNPTDSPTKNPTKNPTNSPTKGPTERPTSQPTRTNASSNGPTGMPSSQPTRTNAPSGSPTNNPTKVISGLPTRSPTSKPTNLPTTKPLPDGQTAKPTNVPTRFPTNKPTNSPTKKPLPDGQTAKPTNAPTRSPTNQPTNSPTKKPLPDDQTTKPNNSQTRFPTNAPTNPSTAPGADDPQNNTETSFVSELIPENFACETAKPILSFLGKVEGTISSFPLIALDGPCLSGLETVGEWYQVTGNGNIFSLTACSLGNSNNIGISVFTGSCSELECIEHQSQQLADREQGNCHAISFTTKQGTIYKVLVSGLPLGALHSSAFSNPTGSSFESSFERRQLRPELKSDFWIMLSETETQKNSKCGSALPVSFDSLVEGSTLGLLTTYKTCEDTIKSGSWYTIEGAPTEDDVIVYQANTCNLESDFYNSISVYQGDRCGSHKCVDADILPCSDGSPGQQVFWSSTSQESYQIFVHSADTVEASTYDSGSFQISVAYGEGLANDRCTAALELELNKASAVKGTISGSKPDMASIENSLCGTGGSGIWYHFVGTGAVFQASTCSSETNHNSRIFIYSGECDGLTCIDSVGGNSALCENDKGSVVNFQTLVNVDYYILVTSREGETGEFGLKVSEIEPSENNLCEAALSLEGSPVLGSTREATVDFYPDDYCGVSLDNPGVWYEVEGTGEGMEISTCLDKNFDSAVSVFKGSCNRLECIAGSSATGISCAGVPGAAVSFLSEKNAKYLVYVHGKSDSQTAMGAFTVSHSEFNVLETNEFCSSALSIPSDGSRIQGSTQDATHTSIPFSSCGTQITNPGLWYSFRGNGNPVEISACSRDDGDFDVSTSVFEGGAEGCGSLTCLAGKNFVQNVCSGVQESRNLEARSSEPAFRLLTQEGTDYFIFMHGTGADGVGNFELSVRDEGNFVITTASPSSTPSVTPSSNPTDTRIQYAKNLHRWVPINSDPLEISTDYLELDIIDPPEGNVTIDGNIINYVPLLNFSGEDAMSIDGCNEGECYRFDVTIDVMGDTPKLTEDKGWNKRLLLLLLLLLTPCICCPLYLFFGKKQLGSHDSNFTRDSINESEIFNIHDTFDQQEKSSLFDRSRYLGSEVDSNVYTGDSSNDKDSRVNYASQDDTTGKYNYASQDDDTTGQYSYAGQSDNTGLYNDASQDDTTGKNNDESQDSTSGNSNSSSEDGSRSDNDNLSDSDIIALNDKFSDEGRRYEIQ